MHKPMALLAVLLLSSCAADGGIAGKTKPVDPRETLRASCKAILTADVAFQAFVKARPDLVEPNGISVEAAIMRTTTVVCAPDFQGDMNGALMVAVSALVDIGTVMQNWQK